MNQFFKFKADILDPRNIEPYRTEWRIAAPDMGIAGSVDFVGRLPDGTYVIIDWKTTKDLQTKMSSAYNKAKLVFLISLFLCMTRDTCIGVQLNTWMIVMASSISCN